MASLVSFTFFDHLRGVPFFEADFLGAADFFEVFLWCVLFFEALFFFDADFAMIVN